MKKKRTSPAKKNYCVWADYVRRMYQHVEASSPQEAYDVAKNTAAWEPCELHDSNGYRLSNEVQDLQTEEFMPIRGSKHCKTCGSEIVETINDSNFLEGECGLCEYERYKSHPELLAACKAMVNGIPDELMDTHLRNLVDRLEAAIEKTNGNAA